MRVWALLLLAACDAATSPSPSPSPSPITSTTTSNVRRADYVGPAVCGECHAENLAGWRETLHRTMNQVAGQEIAPFAGERLRYGDGEAVFEREGGQAVMVLRGTRYRVTRTIGTRYLQEYVGVGPDGLEVRLPFGWWRRAGRWLHQQYFDSWYEAEYGGDGSLAIDPYAVERWADRCAWCHNTYPFELRVRRAAGGVAGQGFERFLEVPTGEDASVLDVEQLVTVGISCESCHLGGREHADGGAITFTPVGDGVVMAAGAPDLSGGRASATVVNTICAQCHSTPTPRHPGGAAVRNSSEALDLAGSACAARCTGCHDPHQVGPGAGAPDDPRHLAACAGCHADVAADARGHARHDPAAVSCLDCHMPRVVQGISDMVRTHRIARPVAAADVERAAVNACNLCHLDRSIDWTLASLERDFGAVAPPAGRLWGDGGAAAGEVWLDSADSATRIAAAAAYGRSRLGRRALPRVLDVLDDPVAHTRMRVLFAVEAILGRTLRPAEYDPTGRPDRRAAQAGRLRARLRSRR